MRALLIAPALVLACAAAWGADVVVDRAPGSGVPPEPSPYDGTVEFAYDSGVAMWWVIWNSGEGNWVGQGFNIATFSAYNGIKAIKLQSRVNWPNPVWDGFRIGVFSFAGGVPGSVLWGPTFVVPTGGTGWKEFSVDWVLPGGTTSFLAGQEQYYDYPNCEAYAIDNNPTCTGYPWQYTRGAWSTYYNPTTAPYRNLMIRVIMSDEVDVAPTSIGRVKALYH